MKRQLRIGLAEDCADPERLDRLTRQLREELLGFGVHIIGEPALGPPPVGSRAVDVAAVGGMLIGLQNAATSLRPTIAAIRGWLERGQDASRTVRMEIDGDVLELSDASAADQARLVELFIVRHTVASGVPA